MGVDTETNYTEKENERYCLGVSISTDVDAYYIPVGHQKGWLGTPNNIIIPTDLFEGVKAPLLAHNWKFDYKVLRKIGIDLTHHNLWDTLAMAHLHNEWNAKLGGGHKLEQVAPRYLGIQAQKEVARAKVLQPVWEISPPALMATYAEQDARLLPELYEKLKSLLNAEQLTQWQEVDREFMLLLADIETLGLPIDRMKAEELYDQVEQRMFAIERELGFDPAKPSQLHPKLFDNPPYGQGLKIASHTPTGKPKVDLDFLAANMGNRVAALCYEHSKLGKQLSSYFGPYLSLTTRDYARLHCDFRQYGTMTGRMSCADPNLQQIPREEYKDANIKKLFDPESGKQLWEIDFRTLEYRMMAVYSQQPELLEIFHNEGDLHQMVADQVGVDRHTAKNKIVYAIAYGAGDKTIAEGIGRGLKEGYDIVRKVKASYPLLFQTKDDAQRVAEETMEIPMWFGRKRHFKWSSECRKAFNSIVQGGSFEIVKRSMLNLRNAGYTMSNQVHDSVWINVESENEVESAQKLMEDWTVEAFGLRFSTDRKRLK